MNQRLFHKGTEHPGSHRLLCLVQHPEQGPPLLLFTERLNQLQVTPCGGVEHHKLAGCIGGDSGQVIQ